MVLAIGAAVLGFVLFYASTVDARPPSVASFGLTHRLGSAESVALTNSSVEVIFSEAVDRAAAERSFRIEPRVQGSFGWRGNAMTFTPDAPLPLDTEFEVVLSAGVRDAAGNVMDEASPAFEFRTVGRPRVVSSLPAQGSVVEADASIVLTFSTLMDTASVERALTVSPPFAHELHWSGDAVRIEPVEPLPIGTRYAVTIDEAASDVAGVRLDRPFVLRFAVVADALDVAWLMPADGLEGVSTVTPVAIAFADPIDPASLQGALQIEPAVAGSIAVIDPGGAAAYGGAQRTIVRFLPAAPLPPNTTFEVRLDGVQGVDGVTLGEAMMWSFTTGVPSASLRDQIVFVSERAGVTNLWAMNPDGTNQHQLSAELSAVTEYAVSPDGTRFVVGDGAQLVEQLADGSDRRVLSDPEVLEFDPSYSPDGRQLAFARADPATGGGLGLWLRDTGGDGAVQVVGSDVSSAPAAGGAAPTPTPSDATAHEDAAAPTEPLLRAPRFSPDGRWLAFIDTRGGVATVELATGQIGWAPFVVTGAPSWSPDSRRIVFAGVEPGQTATPPPLRPGRPVAPLEALRQQVDLEEARIAVLSPGDERARRLALSPGASDPAFTAGRGLVYLSPLVESGGESSALWTATALGAEPRAVEAATGLGVTGLGVGPRGERVVVATERGLWLVNLDGDEAIRLAGDGEQPAWTP